MKHTFIAERTIDVPSIVLENGDTIDPQFISGDDAVAERVRYEYGDAWLEINPEFAGAREWFYCDQDGTEDTSYDFEEIIEQWLDYSEIEMSYHFKYSNMGSSNRRPKAKGKAPTKKGTNKPPVKKKPTAKKPSVKANKDGSASIRSLKKIQSKRSPAAVKADERKKAKNTIHKKTKTGYKSVSMSDAKKWAKSPGSMDIQGVDTKPKYPKRRN